MLVHHKASLSVYHQYLFSLGYNKVPSSIATPPTAWQNASAQVTQAIYHTLDILPLAIAIQNQVQYCFLPPLRGEDASLPQGYPNRIYSLPHLMRYKSITYLPSRISTALIFTPRYNSALSSTVTSPGWDVIPLQGYPQLSVLPSLSKT